MVSPGALPQGRAHLERLVREERVRGVVSVVEDFELRNLGCDVRSVPVPPPSPTLARPLTRPLTQPIAQPIGPASPAPPATLAHLHLVTRDFVQAPTVEQIELAISFIDQVCIAAFYFLTLPLHIFHNLIIFIYIIRNSSCFLAVDMWGTVNPTFQIAL